MTVAQESNDKIELILNTVSQMSTAEAKEFKDKVAEKFGVSFPQTSAAVVEVKQEAEEKQTEFEIVLTEVGPKKLELLKTIREVFGCSLQECKTATESVPYQFPNGPYTADKSFSIKMKLEAAGATVTLK